MNARASSLYGFGCLGEGAAILVYTPKCSVPSTKDQTPNAEFWTTPFQVNARAKSLYGFGCLGEGAAILVCAPDSKQMEGMDEESVQPSPALYLAYHFGVVSLWGRMSI